MRGNQPLPGMFLYPLWKKPQRPLIVGEILPVCPFLLFFSNFSAIELSEWSPAQLPLLSPAGGVFCIPQVKLGCFVQAGSISAYHQEKEKCLPNMDTICILEFCWFFSGSDIAMTWICWDLWLWPSRFGNDWGIIYAIGRAGWGTCNGQRLAMWKAMDYGLVLW